MGINKFNQTIAKYINQINQINQTFLINLIGFISFILFFYFLYAVLPNLVLLFSIFSILLGLVQMYKLTYRGISKIFIISYSILLAFFSFIGFDIVNENRLYIFNFGQFINISDYYQINLVFFVDYVSILFIILITLITLLVLFFIKSYFKLEPELNKFTTLIVSFSLSMTMLVLSANFFLFFFFWEMIGLTSFFLINFYSLKNGTFKASFKAFYFNKISDSFILIGSVLFINEGYDLINLLPGNILMGDSSWLPLIFFYLGASVKSSQLGFHFWLPDSMEAPVPASALIHSATLVSAGVYILVRLNSYVVLFKFLYTFLYIWYSMTALYGGLVAMYQIDIKRLLAYSTISHCGFLFVTTLNGNVNHTMIYLCLHGIFKAISFIIAGRIIQQLETQDLRLMTQLYPKLPLDSILFIFSICNLGALPGSMGLYYKTLFMSSLLLKDVNSFVLALNFLGCLTGVGYSLHVIKIFFATEIRLPKPILNKNDLNIHMSGNMLLIIILTAILFIFIIILLYFNNSLYLEIVKLNNVYLYKLYYSIVVSYIFIVINLDVKKKKIIFFYFTLPGLSLLV